MITNKLVFFFTLALAVVLLPELSFAVISPPEDPTLSSQLCDLRRLFCGAVGKVLMMGSVIMVGIMVLSGKIHWSFPLMMSVAIMFFYNADWIADMFIEDVVECTC